MKRNMLLISNWIRLLSVMDRMKIFGLYAFLLPILKALLTHLIKGANHFVGFTIARNCEIFVGQ
jgi:hypothetical protein